MELAEQFLSKVGHHGMWVKTHELGPSPGGSGGSNERYDWLNMVDVANDSLQYSEVRASLFYKLTTLDVVKSPVPVG